VGIERDQTKGGIRYRMNRTVKKFTLFGQTFPTITLNLPFISETTLRSPQTATLGEALGSHGELQQRGEGEDEDEDEGYGEREECEERSYGREG